MGVLLSNFIHHPAFRIPANWNELIKKPMLRQRRGAARLLRVLEGIVVRNQPSDVKLCFDLPPLVSTIQYLSFEPSECKMYNALIAFFTANSILSQRTDVSPPSSSSPDHR
jgi:SNF2 family DNA or RNA helicase